MKKTLAILLVMLLTVFCAAEEGQLVTVDLGDFTLMIDPATPGEIVEKAEQAVFFTAYPNYDENAETHTALNIIWSEIYEDLTAKDPEAVARQIMENTANELTESGVAAENPQFIQAALDELDGFPALFSMYSLDLDYSGMGVDLQTTMVFTQVITGSEETGLYTFTIGGSEYDGMLAATRIIDTLKWKKQQ